MQPQSQLNLQLKPGSPASAVPRKWFMFINNVLRFLTVQNGTLIANNDKWTLVCGGNVWSGYYWFGGQVNGDEPGANVEPITAIAGKYFGCNLRTGQTAFADDPMSNLGIEEWEWRYVADKDEDTGEYTLSNRTCGDIVFRIV
jgi:hypothetical protein